MSLRKYIDDEFENEDRTNILETIKRWLGNVELTDNLEKNPDYSNAIISVINLMRHSSFDWINVNETSIDIGERWLDIHKQSGNKLSYGIRFSTTKPKCITFGFFYSYYSKLSSLCDYFFVRYVLDNNFMFREINSTKLLSFSQILNTAVCKINGIIAKKFASSEKAVVTKFENYNIHPLNLNHHTLVTSKLDYYIRAKNLVMHGYSSQCIEDDTLQIQQSIPPQIPPQIQNDNNVTHKLLKQGNKVWSL